MIRLAPPAVLSQAARATISAASLTLLLAACGGPAETAPPASNRPAAVAASPARSEVAAPAPTAIVAALRPADELAVVQQQLALLRHDVADLRQQLEGLVRTVRPTQAVADPRRDPQARVEAEQVERQRIVSAESAFRSEREDLRWSQGVATSVRDLLASADEPLRSQVRSVECHAQSCRVEINADGHAQTAPDLPLLLGRLAQTLPKVTAGQFDQGDGRQATVLYLSR